jgi:hypothetical protein
MLAAFTGYRRAAETGALVRRFVEFEAENAFVQGEDVVELWTAFREEQDVAGLDIYVEEVPGDDVEEFEVDVGVIECASAVQLGEEGVADGAWE